MSQNAQVPDEIKRELYEANRDYHVAAAATAEASARVSRAEMAGWEHHLARLNALAAELAAKEATK